MLSRSLLILLQVIALVSIGDARKGSRSYEDSAEHKNRDRSGSYNIRYDRYYKVKEEVHDSRIQTLSSTCSNYNALKGTYSGQLVYRCLDYSCIPIEMRCSGYYECPDNSDEVGCVDFCRAAIDEGLSFKCTSRTKSNAPDIGPEYPECFPATYRCDGFVDCKGGYDDENDKFCPHNSFQFLRAGKVTQCSPVNNFLCSDLRSCISKQGRCDGIALCFDGSDEAHCSDK